MTLDTNDPELLYGRFAAHVGWCPNCTAKGECPDGRQLLRAFLDAWELADKQAIEADRGALIEAGELDDCVQADEPRPWGYEL